jgi:hypothetical protein
MAPDDDGDVTRITARLLSLLAALCLGLVTVAVFPADAHACTCEPISKRTAAERADAVFTGRVLEVTTVRKPEPGRVEIRFEASRVYKGSVFSEQVVATPATASNCGVDLEVGSSWVVFAVQRFEGTGNDAVLRLATDACNGLIPGTSAPTLLGRGRPPLAGASDRAERAVATDATVTGALKVGGLVGLGLVVLVGTGLAVLWRPGRTVRKGA